MIKVFLNSAWLELKLIFAHDNTSTTVGMVVASIGTVISALMGGWDYPLLMLICFIILDYITGFMAGIREHRLSSDIMYWGIIRKIAELILVAVAVSLDNLMHNDPFIIRLMVIYFYIGMEGLSVLENLVKLGVRVPKKLVIILRKMEDEENNNMSAGVADLDDFSIRKVRRISRKDE